MNVMKTQLADIFGVSARTITTWQSLGMPVLEGDPNGGRGGENRYSTKDVIDWYTAREAELENGKLRKEVDELRRAGEADLLPGTIDYERYRLTRAQADAQELKNEVDRSEVIPMEILTFILPRVAGGISSKLDGILLTIQRKYPAIGSEYLDAFAREIAVASNQAAAIYEDLDRWLDEFNRARGQ